VVRAKLDIALWSGLYVIYNPVVSFDLRCQSGISIFNLTSTLLRDVTDHVSLAAVLVQPASRKIISTA